MALSPCTLTGSLADLQYDLMRRVNRKFEAMRRLALLLEQLGDLTSLIPDIQRLIPLLIPVNLIDFTLYNQLAQGCPMLGLPSYGEGPLIDLQQKVSAAYANYAGKILNSPYMRMRKLQGELDRFIGSLDGYQSMVGSALMQGAGYIECLNALCRTTAGAVSLAGRAASTDFTVEASKFANTFAKEGGQVLTGPLKEKSDTAHEAWTSLQTAGADAKGDYTVYDNLARTGSTPTVSPSMANPRPLVISMAYPNSPFAN